MPFVVLFEITDTQLQRNSKRTRITEKGFEEKTILTLLLSFIDLSVNKKVPSVHAKNPMILFSSVIKQICIFCKLNNLLYMYLQTCFKTL